MKFKNFYLAAVFLITIIMIGAVSASENISDDSLQKNIESDLDEIPIENSSSNNKESLEKTYVEDDASSGDSDILEVSDDCSLLGDEQSSLKTLLRILLQERYCI